jgi:hypothetical protein
LPGFKDLKEEKMGQDIREKIVTLRVFIDYVSTLQR